MQSINLCNVVVREIHSFFPHYSIQSIIWSYWLQFQNISQIQLMITQPSTATSLVQFIDIFRLDYFRSLLTGLFLYLSPTIKLLNSSQRNFVFVCVKGCFYFLKISIPCLFFYFFKKLSTYHHHKQDIKQFYYQQKLIQAMSLHTYF